MTPRSRTFMLLGMLLVLLSTAGHPQTASARMRILFRGPQAPSHRAFPCDGKTLEACIANALESDCGLDMLDPEGPLTPPEVEVTPVPTPAGIPDLVIVRIVGDSCCGMAGNCPNLLLARDRKGWRQEFGSHGTGMLAIAAPGSTDWPWIAAASRLGGHWSDWHFHRRIDGVWTRVLTEYRSGDPRSCLARRATVEALVGEWCPDGMHAATQRLEQGDTEGQLEVPVWDVEVSDLAESRLPEECYEDALGNSRWVLFLPANGQEQACIPVLSFEGTAWSTNTNTGPYVPLDEWLFLEPTAEPGMQDMLRRYDLGCAARLKEAWTVLSTREIPACIQTLESLGAGEVGLSTWMWIGDRYHLWSAVMLLAF